VDNWKDRNKTMICDTCIYFCMKNSHEVINIESKTRIIVGRCRRHSPSMSGYPVVYPSDWCGDHKIDENKTIPETNN
jgi:hypothetical protein